ncbi:hypothetical protein JCM10908_004405 [Rhodotorula pacifica]|uniref:uncharacterized protein n=1 Tax=Rhodotorula pacifica TaxID=1495444 RepID=UPI00316ED458
MPELSVVQIPDPAIPTKIDLRESIAKLSRVASGLNAREWRNRNTLDPVKRNRQVELWSARALERIAAVLPKDSKACAWWLQLKTQLDRWLNIKYKTLVYARDRLGVPAVDIAIQVCQIDTDSVLVDEARDYPAHLSPGTRKIVSA